MSMRLHGYDSDFRPDNESVTCIVRGYRCNIMKSFKQNLTVCGRGCKAEIFEILINKSFVPERICFRKIEKKNESGFLI
jgi:hypothetical protein